MNIFQETKEYVTARNVAEYHGLKIGRNGLACCPFHNDHHPSMKIDKYYYCFACGAKGDAISYEAEISGLSQYDAACRIIDNFRLPISITVKEDEQKILEYQKQQEEQKKILQIREQFEQWSNQSIETIRNSIKIIQNIKYAKYDETIIFGPDYAMLMHIEPLLQYWIDILCVGEINDRQKFFLQSRKRVKEIAEDIRGCRQRIMDEDRKYLSYGA